MSIIAKYKFNNTLYDLFPEFNSGYTGYTYTDEVYGDITTRTIESDSLPTLMRFGRVYVDGETSTDNRTDSLLEVLDMNTSGLTSCLSMFRYCKNLTSITCEWDTSKITDMQGMFDLCQSLSTLDTSNWNTSNVTTMQSIFYSCNSLITLDVINWNTSNVTNMQDMFYNCTNLTTLDVSNFNTSSVTTMNRMFLYCYNLTTLDVSNWNTSNVTRMDYMFQNCNSLTTLDVSNFNTSNVTRMDYMFYNCSSLTSLDVSNFDTSKVTGTTSMFDNTPLLTDIGMIYCDLYTINKVGTLTEATLYIGEDIDQSQYTGTAPLKVYKETTKEYTLTSPLLKGDKIEEIDGKVYHYHKMGKVVLDGTLSIKNVSFDSTNTNGSRYWIPILILTETVENNINNLSYNNRFPSEFTSDSDREELIVAFENQVVFLASTSRNFTQASDVVNFFKENPTTVVYELAEPYYELISEEPFLLDSHKDGHIQIETVVPQETIEFKPLYINNYYLYPSRTYTIQFDADRIEVITITLGGTTYVQATQKGRNKIQIATSSTLVDNYLILKGNNVVIDNLVIKDSNEITDYFEGLKSSFETSLVTDENDENYGKYKVDVKVTGKNKCSLNSIVLSTDKVYYEVYLKKGQNYVITIPYSDVGKHIEIYDNIGGNVLQKVVDWVPGFNYRFISNVEGRCYLNIWCTDCHLNYSNIQLEEGTVATPYEPYKESVHTLYLNSPLLEGDRIEAYNGKFCHYHKMGKVVLDGSENWLPYEDTHDTNIGFYYNLITATAINNTFKGYSDNFKILGNVMQGKLDTDDTGIVLHPKVFKVAIPKSKLLTLDVNGFKQWLSENPTTVVYELAEPYYEEIEPTQEDLILTVFNNCHLTLNTVIPPTTTVTYSTNIASVTGMATELEQTQVVQNEQDAMIIDNAVAIATMQLTL